MPVDKLGRMSDAKIRDTGVSLTYINNNYIRNDGSTGIAKQRKEHNAHERKIVFFERSVFLAKGRCFGELTSNFRYV